MKDVLEGLRRILIFYFLVWAYAEPKLERQNLITFTRTNLSFQNLRQYNSCGQTHVLEEFIAKERDEFQVRHQDYSILEYNSNNRVVFSDYQILSLSFKLIFLSFKCFEQYWKNVTDYRLDIVVVIVPFQHFIVTHSRLHFTWFALLSLQRMQPNNHNRTNRWWKVKKLTNW